MKRELLELRTKLSRQEGLLQSTAERLQSATRQKESLEQFILSQCGCPRAREWGKGGWGFRMPHGAVDGQCGQIGQGTGETGTTVP